MSFSKLIWLNHRDTMHPRAGGAERTIYEVSTRLVKRGYEVVWLSTRVGNLPRYEEIDGVQIYRLGGNISSHMRNILFGRNSKDGTVTIDDLAHVVPWLSERFTKLPGTVFFRHLHRRTLEGQVSPFKANLLKAIESNYSRVYRKYPFVTESKQGVQDLINLGIPKERVVKIPPGVDYEKLKSEEKYAEPSLVYFGGFREYKRPSEALHLLTMLREDYPGIKLRIAGNGPSLQKTKDLARSLRLNGSVDFLGKIDESVLFDIVSRSWLNLHFSRAEGWGYSILEASACGTPTLAYDAPGVSEAVENGVNGIKVPDGNRETLFSSARQILGNHANWVAKSRNHAKKYSWEDTTDMWERHLQNLYL